MIADSNEFVNGQNDHSQATENTQPNAYRVNDGDDGELEQTRSSGQSIEIKEGQPMGGQNFNKNNLTPAGDDKNNPSQNAGYGNAYFSRTEPSEEHPEDTNFTAKSQQGAPDYDSAQPNATSAPGNDNETKKQNDTPNPQQPYQEGTDDNDGNSQLNIPGPNELPDQQKVGEDDNSDEKYHVET